MSAVPLLTSATIEAHLHAIAAEFKPGAKLTLLVRNDVGVGLDADLVMTNDSLPDAIAGLQRQYARDEWRKGEQPPEGAN